MIKKIALLCAVFMIVAMPCVLADAAPDPNKPDGDHIDFECRVISDEIEIEGDFIFEITVTNLTKSKMELYRIDEPSLRGVWDAFSIFDENGKFLDRITLDGYESIVMEITGRIDDRPSWYRKNGGYYYTFEPDIEYVLDDGYPEKYYYETLEEGIEIKISNLYDDPGYMQLTWTDDVDTIHYYEGFNWYEDEGEEVYYEGKLYPMINHKNVSDVTIEDIPAGETKVDCAWVFMYEKDAGDIKDSVEYEYEYYFNIEDKYYVATIAKTFKTEIIEPPEINMEIIPIESNDDLGDTYKIIVHNPNDYAIDNFTMMTQSNIAYFGDENYIKTADIDANSSIEFTTTLNRYLHNLSVGYMIDGHLYEWFAKFEYTKNETTCLSPVEYYNNCAITEYQFFLEYTDYVEFWRSKIPDLPKYTNTPMPTIENTPEPSIKVIDMSQFYDTVVPDAVPTAEVKVIKRTNGMTWAMIIIAVLILGAVSAVAVTLGKKAGERKDD